MLKLLVKLAVAALIANATWRLASAYVTFYRFKDAVTDAAQHAGQQTSPELRRAVIDLASQFDVPLQEDAFTVRRDGDQHTYVDGSYKQVVELLPGYLRPWTFVWHVDVLTLVPPPPDPSQRR